MCEPGDSGLKLRGYELRAKLAMKRILVAWTIGAGVIIFLGFTYDRLNAWAFWMMVIALASLGLSGYFGGLVAERTARAFRMKGDWPGESEIDGPAYLQKLLIYLAVLLVIAGMVLSV